VTFAYITGWRVPSEVLTLQWRQIDFEAGTARLDPGASKTGVHEIERRLGKVIAQVWCWTDASPSRVQAHRSAASGAPGGQPAERRAFPGASRMTSGAPRSAT
jgi:integrase